MCLKRDKNHFPYSFPWLVLVISLLPVSCIDFSTDSDEGYVYNPGRYTEGSCLYPWTAPDSPWTHSIVGDGDVTMVAPDGDSDSTDSDSGFFTFYEYYKLHDYGKYILFQGKDQTESWMNTLWAVDTETWNISRKIVLPNDTNDNLSLFLFRHDYVHTFGNRTVDANSVYHVPTNIRPYEDKVLYWEDDQVALISYESEKTLIDPAEYPCKTKRFVPFPEETKLIMADLENWSDGSGTLSILNNELTEIATIPLYEKLSETLGEEVATSFLNASTNSNYYRPFYVFWENAEKFLFMFTLEEERPDEDPIQVDPTFIRFSGDTLTPEAVLDAQGCPTFGTHIPQSSLALLHTYYQKTSFPSCLIDFETMEVIDRYPETSHFEMSPDGKRLVLLAEDGDEENASWLLLDLESFQSEEIPTDEPMIPERFSPDSKRLLAYPEDDGGLVVYNLETGEWNSLGVSSVNSYRAFSTEGDELYIGGDAVGLKRFDLVENTQEMVSIDVGSWLGEEFTIRDLRMLFGVSGGKYLLLGFANTRSVLVYDTETQEVTTRFELH